MMKMTQKDAARMLREIADQIDVDRYTVRRFRSKVSRLEVLTDQSVRGRYDTTDAPPARLRGCFCMICRADGDDFSSVDHYPKCAVRIADTVLARIKKGSKS